MESAAVSAKTSATMETLKRRLKDMDFRPRRIL